MDLTSPECVDACVARVKEARLDGIYLEFENDMLVAGSVTQKHLKSIAQRVTVGVWSYDDQTDGLERLLNQKLCFEVLVELGVTYVNSNIKRNS